MLFEVIFPNLVCECILELPIVPFHFPVNVTLTSDLVYRICIESGKGAHWLSGRVLDSRP